MPSPSQNFTRRVYHGARTPHPGDRDALADALEALAVFTAAVAVFIAVGATAGPGTGGLVVAQLIGLLGAPLAWATARGSVRDRLGLAAPPARALVGAALFGVAFWYLNLRLAQPIVRAVGTEELVRLEERIAAPSLAVRLVAIAIVPALCEEIVSRGVLARGLRPALGRVGAVLVSALLFAAFHLSLVRLLPTFTLGVALAAITLAADSVWPAILAHLINNAIALALTDGALRPIAEVVSDHPDLAVGASALVSAAGLVIALAPRRRV